MDTQDKNSNFYRDLHDINGKIPENPADLTTEQKAEVAAKMKDTGSGVKEIAEYLGVSSGYVYRLLRESTKDIVSELECRTYLDNYVSKTEMLSSRIDELSKIMETEIPRYEITIDDDGEENRRRISGNANNYTSLARLRQGYEEQLIRLDDRANLLPNKDHSIYDTIGAMRPEELVKDDMEQMSDQELMMKFIEGLKRQGQSAASMTTKMTLANVKNEKILGN